MSDEQQTFFDWQDANPLLKEIPLGWTFQSVGLILPHNPKVLWEGDEPQLSRIPRLIRRIDQVFVGTKMMVEFALQFIGLLIQGLEARDPRVVKNRARPYETGRFKGMKLEMLPWLGGMAGGMVLEGMTGVSKSMVIKRILQFLPQVVPHDKSDEYGWDSLKQLVYLVVPMPASAKLGPFLLEVVMQMDALLGTNYSASIAGSRLSDDKRAVLVLHWLSLHRCGFLIVEECQERNLPQHVFGSDFLSLFLRAMNWGIPVCVVGNPKALATIRTFTQDGRRFSVGHWFTFEPVWDFRTSVWRKDLVPGIWGWNPVDAQDQHIPNLELYLWKKTGGVPGFLAILRKESLMAAWRAGRAHVEQTDVEDAFKGRAMALHHKLIDALTSYDAGTLAALTDIPADSIVARWKQLGFLEPPEQAAAPPASDSLPASAPAKPQRDAEAKVAKPPSTPVAPAESAAQDAGVHRPATAEATAPAAAVSPNAGAEPDRSKEPDAPPAHHAPDQHVDRRSDAFKRLLGTPQPRRR